MYADNEFKFVAVLNAKIGTSTLMNVLGHITAGLVGGSTNVEAMNFLRYQDGDGGAHPGISHFPFIVLSAKNGNQIRTLRNALIERDIPFTDFVDTMLGSSAEDQLQKTGSTSEADLDYYGLSTFHAAAEIDALTKKFSLFRRE